MGLPEAALPPARQHSIPATSLGLPPTPEQMLVDDIGDVTITNDGATILKLLEVEHPAAKVRPAAGHAGSGGNAISAIQTCLGCCWRCSCVAPADSCCCKQSHAADTASTPTSCTAGPRAVGPPCMPAACPAGAACFAFLSFLRRLHDPATPCPPTPPHHYCQILVELAELQDQEVGDGTTSVVIVAAELLRRANELVRQKIHPTSIIGGYRLAMREVRWAARPDGRQAVGSASCLLVWGLVAQACCWPVASLKAVLMCTLAEAHHLCAAAAAAAAHAHAAAHAATPTACKPSHRSSTLPLCKPAMLAATCTATAKFPHPHSHLPHTSPCLRRRSSMWRRSWPSPPPRWAPTR